jgi:3-hydroxyacyl-[acyl-carrier-protein] dehydratase
VTETALAIAPDHPAYVGHFPGHPILPAVVLLAEILAKLPGLSIVSAKFVRTVAPGTPLTLAHEATDGGGVRFEVRAPNGLVASGRLAPAR